MRKIFTALFGVLISSSCFAQTNSPTPIEKHFDSLAVGKITYTNCTVKPYNAAEVIIRFSAGGAKALIADLPEEVQKLFHYDPVAAAVVIEVRKQAELRRQQQIAEQQRLKALQEQRAVELARQQAAERQKQIEQDRTNRPQRVIIVPERRGNYIQRIGGIL